MIRIIEDIIGVKENNTAENNSAVKRIIMRFAARVTKDNEGEYWTTPFYLTLSGELQYLKDWLISNQGRVAVRMGKGIKILTIQDNNGKDAVKLGRMTFQLDRLMASTFLPFEEEHLQNDLKNLVAAKDPLVPNPFKLKWITKSESLAPLTRSKAKLIKGTIDLDSPWKGFSFTIAGRARCEELGFNYPGISTAMRKGTHAHACTWEEVDEATYHKYGHLPPEDFLELVQARDPILDPRTQCYLASVTDPVTKILHTCVFIGQSELDRAGLASPNVRNCVNGDGYAYGYNWVVIPKQTALNKNRKLTPEMKMAGEKVQARRTAAQSKPVFQNIKYGKDFILTAIDVPEYKGERFFVKGARVEQLGFRYRELVKAAEERFLVMGFSIKIAKEGDAEKYPRFSPVIAAVVENHPDSSRTIIRNSTGNHRAINAPVI